MVKIFDLDLPNPVGLGAGMNKYGLDINLSIENSGAGFTELGSVTYGENLGNPEGKIAKFGGDSCYNNLSAPNKGLPDLLMKIRGADIKVPIGISIIPRMGSLKYETDGMDAECPASTLKLMLDMIATARLNIPFYVAINKSCPSLPPMMVHRTMKEIDIIAQGNYPFPIMIKKPADFSDEGIAEFCQSFIKTKAKKNIKNVGFIVSNSIPARLGGSTGGLMTTIGLHLLKEYRKHLTGEHYVPIISSGGIMTQEDAMHRLEDGADAIQLHTTILYNGHQRVREIVDYVGTQCS